MPNETTQYNIETFLYKLIHLALALYMFQKFIIYKLTKLFVHLYICVNVKFKYKSITLQINKQLNNSWNYIFQTRT